VAAGSGGDKDQAIGAFLDRLVGEFLVDHVVKNDAAPAVGCLVELLARAKRSDDDRHLVLFAERQIMVEPVVGTMHDLVDGERGRRRIGMGGIMRCKFGGNPRQPLIEQVRRTRIQGGKRSDDSGLALSDHEIRDRNDEQRRADYRNRQATLEQGRHGHQSKSFKS
jgi:hypothetical protein